MRYRNTQQFISNMSNLFSMYTQWFALQAGNANPPLSNRVTQVEIPLPPPVA
jgi:hypothetical protein